MFTVKNQIARTIMSEFCNLIFYCLRMAFRPYIIFAAIPMSLIKINFLLYTWQSTHQPLWFRSVYHPQPESQVYEHC